MSVGADKLTRRAYPPGVSRSLRCSDWQWNNHYRHTAPCCETPQVCCIRQYKVGGVLRRIREEGPLQTKDFERPRSSNAGWWQWKPAKIALEQLFMEGRLMVVRRQGFQKVYDLTERVLPPDVDTRAPSESEYHRHLINNYLTANGIATPAQIAYLRRGIKANVQKQCVEMVEDNQLEQLRVNQQNYYALPNFEALLTKPLSRTKVKILSPFDNLLIQRQRTRELFNFDYLIECYVPAAKRKYGYFCLPILWGQQFAARMDAKIDRKSGVLIISNLYVETRKESDFIAAFEPCLQAFLVFNKGHRIQLERISRSPKC